LKDHLFTPIDTWDYPEQLKFAEDFPPARFFKGKGNFIWWWWMFMFTEDGVRKQIVAFWTTKSYGKIKINGVDWRPRAEIEGTEKEFSYNGMSTWWLWDGKRFHETEPMVSKFRNKMHPDGFEIRSDDVTNTIDRDSFLLRFARDPEKFDLTIDRLSVMPPPVGYKKTMLTKKMGFDALKIYHVGASGTLTTDGNTRPVEGSLYMQHICLNSPAFPWLWGVFHKDDGSYLTYFTSFFGRYAFRRRAECKPKWDNRFRYMNKNFNYTPKGQETKRFKHVKYRVIREGTGLPEYEITGELGKERLKVRVRALGKTTYAFHRWKFWKNKFFYNEFPSEILELEYSDAEGNVHSEDGGEWTGNTEFSWGILLN